MYEDVEGGEMDLVELIDLAHNYGTTQPPPTVADVEGALAAYAAKYSEDAQTEALVVVVAGARRLAELLAHTQDGLEVQAARQARTRRPKATVRRLAEATGLAERYAAARYRISDHSTP